MTATMTCALWAWIIWAAVMVNAQYLGEEELDPLQKTAYIDGKDRDLDLIGHSMNTNRTTAKLDCASGYMNVVVNFYEPFYGLIYPNGSRNSPCTTHGNGKQEYTLNLPLKGCGTHRVDRRVFMNNIIVRFHKGLELEGDEVKTIICRYPSPIVLLPPVPPGPLIAGPPPVIPSKQVGEVEILMIICAILFLALLLVGMACSYTCLKKRNIRIVRRRPMTLGTPSEISKISASPMLPGLKIPRATISDSDTTLVSETIPSDYPSESPSSGSEIEFSIPVEEDRLSSVYSDAMVQSEAETFAPQMLLKPLKPTFVVRVKKAPTPPRTPEPDYSLQNALSQSLTTILERDESYRAETAPGSERAFMLTESEDDMYTPHFLAGQNTVQAQRIMQEQLAFKSPTPPSASASVSRSISEQDLIVETHAPPRHMDVQRIENVTNLTTQITDIEEIVDRGKRRYIAPREPSEPDSDYPSEMRSVTDVVEDLEMIPRPPQLTTHMVDDRYLTTLTETHTTEDVEKHRRFIKQYHMKPKPLPPPKWNVAIRHYPGPKYADELESSGPEWEGYSEPGSDVFRAQMLDGIDETLSQIDVERVEHPPPHNWPILLKVLDPPPTEEAVRYVLTDEDRNKWRQILTTESTLRTMLTKATVREDFERIRHDQRYEKLFEPQKWDVIIRILSPPGAPSRHGDETSSEAFSMSDSESMASSRDGKRYRKYESATASYSKKRMPPLYEFDADGNPLIKNVPGPPSSRSRRSSKSSLVSGQDVRSIAETEVNYSRQMDSCSEASGPSVTSAGARSHADRSHSEMTYSVPVLPMEDYPDTDNESRTSARTGRSLARSASEFTEDWRHHDRYSVSSVESKPNRQLERSTSEYMEEAPHLSDFPLTSPDHSPSPSPTMPSKYRHQYENYGYEVEQQQPHSGVCFVPEEDSYDQAQYVDHREQVRVHRGGQEHHSTVASVSQHQHHHSEQHVDGQHQQHHQRVVHHSEYRSSAADSGYRQGRALERELADLYPLDISESDGAVNKREFL